jgi:hypothetical protein
VCFIGDVFAGISASLQSFSEKSSLSDAEKHQGTKEGGSWGGGGKMAIKGQTLFRLTPVFCSTRAAAHRTYGVRWQSEEHAPTPLLQTSQASGNQSVSTWLFGRLSRLLGT